MKVGEDPWKEFDFRLQNRILRSCHSQWALYSAYLSIEGRQVPEAKKTVELKSLSFLILDLGHVIHFISKIRQIEDQSTFK